MQNWIEIMHSDSEKQQKKIERVVCSGGGAKGVVYAGSYKAMRDTGVYPNVESFSGASAGAITAAFMALGMPADKFREQLLTTNFKDLMGETVGQLLGTNLPGISFVTKDGQPMEDFLRQNIIATVRDLLKDIENGDAAFQQLMVKLENDNPKITFADLALLHRLFPNQFKKLIVSAVKFPGGELQIFNSELTPDVEIALACRASASIPVVLAPVEIEINGVVQKFIDGGLYDNLPTDYFDKNDEGAFIPNQKPLQTMVFAFGEGLDNSKNQVFQALYGGRWDDWISNQILQDILQRAFERCKNELRNGKKFDSSAAEVSFIMKFVQTVVDEMKGFQKITSDEANVLIKSIKQSVRQVLLKPKENLEFWQAYREANSLEKRVEILTAFVKQSMKPLLYKAGYIERLKRDVLIELFAEVKSPYKNTARKEIGYQKLRLEYPLRTVELRIGDIKTTDFVQATRFARVMDSLGYLDTVNYITNHELEDPTKFDAAQFYIDIVKKFEYIYQATLASSGANPNKSLFLSEINALKDKLQKGKSSIDEAEINRQVYQLIKDKAELRFDSMEAFALARAVEFHNGTMDAQKLFSETYLEGFKRSSIFSISNISGISLFGSSALGLALKDKNMFNLHKLQKKTGFETRTDKVYEALKQLEGFDDQNSISPSKTR